MTTSYEWLKDFLYMQNAEKVNLFIVPRDGFRHNTSPEEHPVRNKYCDIEQLKNLEINNINETIALATTYKSNGKYQAFIGLDIEYPYSVESLQILERIKVSLSLNTVLFKTKNGLHVFIPETYNNDIELWNRIGEILETSFKELNDMWATEYSNRLKNVKDFSAIQEVAKEILNKIGHYKKGLFTFVDLRHLAHGILSNERFRDQKVTDNGVRTQLFFRINKRDYEDFFPTLSLK